MWCGKWVVNSVKLIVKFFKYWEVNNLKWFLFVFKKFKVFIKFKMKCVYCFGNYSVVVCIK